MANYILEGVYFYSGFMFFYNLSRNGKMPGSAQEIRYINRDENTHLWLFRNIILELQKEQPELFGTENVRMMREHAGGGRAAGDRVGPLCHRRRDPRPDAADGDGLYQVSGQSALDAAWASARCMRVMRREPANMAWVSQYSNANLVKTDFFEAKSTAYAKSTALVDDL